MVTPLLRSRSVTDGATGGGLLVRRDASCAEIFRPTTPPATVTSLARAWNFGAWASLGTPSQDLVINYIHVINYTEAAGLVDSTIELAYGAGFTPLDCARELAPFFNPGPTTVWTLPLSQMCQPVVSPAGQGIWARAATNVSVAYSYAVMLLGWLGGLPTFDTITISAINGPGRWYPANTGVTGIGNTSGAGWAYGASSTIIDPAPNDMLVVGLKTIPTVGGLLDTAYVIQFGYGPNGAETWCATTSMGRTWAERWVWPPVLVKAGERLAMRSARAAAVTRYYQVKVYDR